MRNVPPQQNRWSQNLHLPGVPLVGLPAKVCRVFAAHFRAIENCAFWGSGLLAARARRNRAQKL